MDNIIEILNYIDDQFYIIKDMSGNILYKEENINCSSILEKKMIVNNEYHDRERDLWFEVINKQIKYMGHDYILEIFRDITKYKKKEQSLTIDETTNLCNKKLTYNLISEYLDEIRGSKETFSIVLLDIDFFKKINDIYGHLCGDMVLAKIGKILLENTRQVVGRGNDIVGRIGGEEFLILFKNVTGDSIYKRIEEIRRVIEETDFSYQGKIIPTITMSFGIYCVSNDEMNFINDIDSFKSSILKKCDKALYQSKRSGRNKVTEYKKLKEYK